MASPTYTSVAVLEAALASLTVDQRASVKVMPDGKGNFTVAATDAIISAMGSAPAVSAFAPNLIVRAKASADAVTAQVLTAETHIAGYTNAAAWAIAAGGVPTVDPGKTAFASMATANGFSTPQAFATVVLGMSASAMTLSATLATFQVAVEKAAQVSDLTTALTTFEAGIAAEVAALNGAGLTATITAPAAITLPGLPTS